jgi:hypothetical protein
MPPQNRFRGAEYKEYSALYWSSEIGNLRKRAIKAWNYRLTDLTKALKAKIEKNYRLGRISVGDGRQPTARLHRILSKSTMPI